MRRGLQFLFLAISVLYGGTCFAAVSAAPVILSSETSVNFGKVNVGSTSIPHVVSITNKGTAPLVVSGIALAGTNAGDFNQSGDCDTVQPGGFCTVNVVFSPQLPFGNKSASLAISSNDPRKPILNVRLSGQAPPPVISASPSSVNFGGAKVGSTTVPKTVMIKNTGKSPLTVSSLAVSGLNAAEFNQSGDCGTVEPGSFCTVNITFSPALPFGSKSALLTVSSNDPKKPALNVKLKGNAPPPVLSTSTSSVNFGKLENGAISATKSVVVENTGLSDLVLGEPAISGDGAAVFSVVSNCATVLKGESCTIDVTFTPDKPGVKFGATLNITSNAPKKTALHLNLSGQGPLSIVKPPNVVTSVVSGKGKFTNLAFSGNTNTLFWGDGVDSFGKGIWKYQLGANSSQLLVPRLSRTSNMVVQGNYAYWIDTYFYGAKFSLYRTTLDGTQTTLVTQGDAPFRTYLSADDKALYFTAKDPAFPGTSMVVQALPYGESAPTTLYMYNIVGGAEGFASDENYIYVLDESGADSSAANLVRVSKTDGSSQTLSQNIAKVNSAMTIANGSIYIGKLGGLLKMSATGGAPTALLSGFSVEPYWLTVVQDRLYWINKNRDAPDNPYTIQSMPVAGGEVTVVATNLSKPSDLLATTDGLYWSELQNNGDLEARTLKMLSWQTGQVTDIAGGMYISSFAVSGGNAYVTQYKWLTGFSEISMVSLSDGLIHPVFGGVNSTTYTVCATADKLLIGDGSAVKTVPISGGVTTTLAQDAKFNILDVKEQGGTVYFTSDNGVFKVSGTGGTYVALAQEKPGLYGTIVSVQDGYVYYVLSQSSITGKISSDLRRVRIDGTAPSESYFKVPPQYSLEEFDGIGTAYVTEWIYNDQYKYLKYDIATGNTVHLLSGSPALIGMDDSSLFFVDGYSNIFQVPKTGGNSTDVISIPYALEFQYYWVPSGHGFYFVISYPDQLSQRYISEIEHIELTK